MREQSSIDDNIKNVIMLPYVNGIEYEVLVRDLKNEENLLLSFQKVDEIYELEDKIVELS